LKTQMEELTVNLNKRLTESDSRRAATERTEDMKLLFQDISHLSPEDQEMARAYKAMIREKYAGQF